MKKEPKKLIVYSTPEPDYFRKAMMALPKKEVIEEQIKPKTESNKPVVSWAEYSTSDSDSFINNS